ncbi:tetratricopeptide repeat protein [archaeon]|nr:tetratricopeptide repeat protein [archaeon]
MACTESMNPGGKMPGYSSITKNSRVSERFSPSFFRLSIICMLLGFSILILYWQVIDFDFFDLDDFSYVKDNQVVNRGISFSGIKWAFTSVGYSANWHPVTWISHMVDIQLFGLNAGMHHFINVVFHILNSILLFLVLEKMTGALWKSAIVAALFALHPQHVESVAWISERKDVLSTFFWILTMMGYVRYVHQPTATRYLSVILLFVLGLLSKPMVVTLPFVLLLLDYWPLDRLRPDLAEDRDLEAGLRRNYEIHWLKIRRLVSEKIPLFVLALISVFFTIIAQREGGTIKSLIALPFSHRVENAITAYVTYLGKMIYPLNLAVYYPYNLELSLPLVIFSALILTCLTAVAVFSAKKLPFFFVGWFWYLGTLIPVIGLVQVGNQSMADRYTYVPLIGIFVLITWGISEALTRFRVEKRILVAVSALAIFLILGSLSWRQTGYWMDSKTLYQHALDVTRENSPTHLYFAKFLMDRDDLDNAEEHCAEALKIAPDSYAHNLMGMILKKKGEIPKAVFHYSKAIQLNPDYSDAYNGLGVAYMHQGRFSDAYRMFSKALTLDPENVASLINISNYYRSQGKVNEAIHYFNKAVQIKPEIIVQ